MTTAPNRNGFVNGTGRSKNTMSRTTKRGAMVFLADRVLVMTERPGAIAAIYEVPLPRPRSLDAMADPVFTELVQRIRKHFFTQSTLD